MGKVSRTPRTRTRHRTPLGPKKLSRLFPTIPGGLDHLKWTFESPHPNPKFQNPKQSSHKNLASPSKLNVREKGLKGTS